MSSEDEEYKAFLRRRRSIRRYTQEQITNAELNDLMEIAFAGGQRHE
jgi:nitroreductase